MKKTKQITYTLMVFGTATFLLLSWTHCTGAQEVRSWVDSSGQFKIEASYQKLADGNVFLKMPGGNVKQIPLKMLSTGDQDHIRDLNAPAKPTEVAEPTKISEAAEIPQPSSIQTAQPSAARLNVAAKETMPAADTASIREVRTWVDSSGQFKIEATYQKLENNNVFLKMADGQVKQIPFSMLSNGDKAHLRQLTAPQKPAKTPAEIPTTSVATAPSPAPVKSTPSTMPIPKAPETDLALKPDLAPVPDLAPETDLASDTDLRIPESLKPSKPVIHISQSIGDLDIRTIEPPRANGGQRGNPKYLIPVERSELALLPKDFQGAALLLLDEPNNPRKAVPALDYLKVKWPDKRQPVLIKLLINCASSDHKFNRETALQILSNRDSDQSFPYIFARVDDSSFTIRSLAYQILRELGDRRAIDPLARRFASDDVDRISSLLRSFGSATEASILPYLTHEDPDIRLRACSLLGKVGTEKSLPGLQEMAQREQTMMLKRQTESSIKKIKRRTEKSSQ